MNPNNAINDDNNNNIVKEPAAGAAAQEAVEGVGLVFKDKDVVEATILAAMALQTRWKDRAFCCFGSLACTLAVLLTSD